LISLKRANNIFFLLNKTCLLLFLVYVEEALQRMHQTNRLSLTKKFHGLHNKTVCKKVKTHLRRKPQRRVIKEFIMNKLCTFNQGRSKGGASGAAARNNVVIGAQI
jgi:hypothetical protein